MTKTKKKEKKRSDKCPCVFATKVTKRKKINKDSVISLRDEKKYYYCPVVCIWVDFE